MRNLSNWITAYKEYTHGHMEGPPEFHTWMAYSLLSAALQQHVYMDKRVFRIWPNLYCILVGPPATRKSTVMGIGKSILTRACGRTANVLQQKMTTAVLIKEMAEHCKYDPLLGRDASTLNIFGPEFKAMLPNSKEDSGHMIAVLTDCFDYQEHYKYRLISRDTDEADSCILSLTGGSTVDWLKEVLGRKEIGGGFASRIIFVHSNDRGTAVPFPEDYMSDQMRNLEKALIADLRHIHLNLYGQVQFNQEARKFYEHWYKKMYEKVTDEEDLLAGYQSRKATLHVPKIAMLNAIAQRDDLIITLADLQWAQNELHKVETGLKELYAQLVESRSSKDITYVLHQIPIDGIGHAALHRKVHRHVADSASLRKLIATLQEMDLIDIKQVGRGQVYRRLNQ